MKRSVSDHFDGRCFHNPERVPHGALGFLKWMATSKRTRWPDQIPVTPAEKPPAAVQEGIRATFVTHATVLIQVDGVNFLTDPIWSKRCSPVQFFGPRRHREVGLAFEDLPPIHVVMISHDHYDHFDRLTVLRLLREHDPIFVLPIGLERLAMRLGIQKVIFLDWWEETGSTTPLPITFTPGRHFSGRGAFDRNKSLWGGFFVKTSAGPVYYAGDTGYGPQFREIAQRLGRPALALIPIGAYEPYWFMRPVHLRPEDSVQVHLDLQPQQSMAVHFGTFQLSDEGAETPVNDLIAALARQQVPASRFWIPEFGESRVFAGR